MEFYLKWKGYPESENSWEPKRNLSCSRLLKQYMIKHKLIPSTNDTRGAVKEANCVTAKTGQPRKFEVSNKEAKKIKHTPAKIKLPQKRHAAIPLLNTEGETSLKKVKVCSNKSSQKISKPRNHLKASGTESRTGQHCERSNIRTHAHATPLNSSTSSVREGLHVAALCGNKADSTNYTNNCGVESSDDDDVVILHVDPPPNRPHVTQPRIPGFLPSNFSPTDTYFSILSLSRSHLTAPTRVNHVPIGAPISSTLTVNRGLQYTDTDSSATLTVTTNALVAPPGESPCSSPIVSSPLSDNSFDLQLSPSSTFSSSTGEPESPCNSSENDGCQRTSLCQYPHASYVGLLAGLSQDSRDRSRAKLHPSQLSSGTKPVLNTALKQKLNGSLLASKTHERLDFPNRKGRMGPVPRRYQSLPTSPQAKVAKGSGDSSTPNVNVATAVPSCPRETKHSPNDDRVSVIFKFNGMRKQVLMPKHNLFPTDGKSDSDVVAGKAKKAKREVKQNGLLGSFAERNKALTHCNSVNGAVKTQLLSGILRKKVFSSYGSNGILKPDSVNGLSLVHADALASGSASLTNPLQFQPLETVSKSKYCSAAVRLNSVHYKQILLDWQFQLNRQRGGTDDIIFVENEIDRAEPPKDFTYICSNMYGEGVPDPNLPQVRDSLCGCQCYHLGKRCGPKTSYCCSRMADVPFAYTPAGKVCVSPGTPIYECNWKCSCPMDCVNRVVQHGRKIPLCIFRTSNNRGWGVKTLQQIKPNTFVTEYVGEVITSEEAERRGKGYDEEGETYLFDLDFDDDQMFTIDAKNYGNISHFFNHSVSVSIVYVACISVCCTCAF